jgi:hypothetical protein
MWERFAAFPLAGAEDHLYEEYGGIGPDAIGLARELQL